MSRTTKPEVYELRKRLLAYLEANGPSAAAAMKESIALPEGTTPRTLQNLLQRLKMAGEIQHSLDGTWRLTGEQNSPPPSDEGEKIDPAEPRFTRSEVSNGVETPDHQDLPDFAGPARARQNQSPTKPGLALSPPSTSPPIPRGAQAEAKENGAAPIAVSGGSLTIDLHLTLAPAEVLELADRLPDVLKCAAGLMSLQAELEQLRQEQH